MRLFKTRPFARFALEEGIEDDALVEAAIRADIGLIDADLGGGLIKQRVARKGEGKSGGYRTLLAFKAGDKVFFLHGFAKKDIANIDQKKLKLYRIAAKNMLVLNTKQIEGLVLDNEIMEIISHV